MLSSWLFFQILAHSENRNIDIIIISIIIIIVVIMSNSIDVK
jgi:hypothetical protein